MGNLAQWWQPEALRRFADKARCMVEQYSGYRVAEIDMRINGFKTQGENIADNGGLKQAYAVSMAFIIYLIIILIASTTNIHHHF